MKEELKDYLEEGLSDLIDYLEDKEEEEEKEIISKNKFSENKHEHLDDIKCPKCGMGLKPTFDRSHLVGCMEYQLFLCDKDCYETRNYKKHACRILIINYPHKSAGKKNKTIEL